MARHLAGMTDVVSPKDISKAKNPGPKGSALGYSQPPSSRQGLTMASQGRGSRGRTEVASGHYIVRPGDTLSHIARKTGVPVAILKKLNRIEGSLVRAGARLLLAP